MRIRESDQGLFGVVHPGTGKIYVHSRLCFGYKDSPRVACSLSEAVASELRRLGVQCLVFVDDFLVCEDDMESCIKSMLIVEALLEDLGFEISSHKTEGPSKCLTFLGVEVDVRAEFMCYRLPAQKVLKIKAQLEQLAVWEKKKVKKSEGARVGSHSGYVVFCSKDHTGSKCVYESTVGLFECSVCGSVGPTMGEMGSSRYCVK